VTAETLVARVSPSDVSPYFRVARIQLDRGEGLVSRACPYHTDGVVGSDQPPSRVDTSDILLSWIPVRHRRGAAADWRCAASARQAGENGYAAPSNTSCRASKPKKAIWFVTSGLGGFPPRSPGGKNQQGDPQCRGMAQDWRFRPRGLRATFPNCWWWWRRRTRRGVPKRARHKALSPKHGLGVIADAFPSPP